MATQSPTSEPCIKPFAGLVAPTLEELRQHREAILAIASRHGAENVRVIGSVARGEATTDSDIDLLVHFRPGASLLDHAGLMLDLTEYAGREIQVADDEGLRPRVRESVLPDAVAL